MQCSLPLVAPVQHTDDRIVAKFVEANLFPRHFLKQVQSLDARIKTPSLKVFCFTWKMFQIWGGWFTEFEKNQSCRFQLPSTFGSVFLNQPGYREYSLPSLKLTSSLLLKINGWKMNFPFWRKKPNFLGQTVSFREGGYSKNAQKNLWIARKSGCDHNF